MLFFFLSVLPPPVSNCPARRIIEGFHRVPPWGASRSIGRDSRRRSTTSCCRKQMFSIIKEAGDLKQATIAQPTHRNTGPSRSLSGKQEMTAAHGQAESLVIEILRPKGIVAQFVTRARNPPQIHLLKATGPERPYRGSRRSILGVAVIERLRSGWDHELQCLRRAAR